MQFQDLQDHIDERIKQFECKLASIAVCREKELAKPYHKRDMNVLFLLYKDESVYSFCLSEFNTLKETFYEKEKEDLYRCMGGTR